MSGNRSAEAQSKVPSSQEAQTIGGGELTPLVQALMGQEDLCESNPSLWEEVKWRKRRADSNSPNLPAIRRIIPRSTSAKWGP